MIVEFPPSELEEESVIATTVGAKLGFDVTGLIEVGVCVGETVEGRKVGITVGVMEGFKLGVSVGIKDGVFVGAIVGLALGLGVGDSVVGFDVLG